MNTRTALGVAGVATVAVAMGVVGGLFLAGGPLDGGGATPTATATPDPTPVPTTATPTATPAPTPTGTPEPVVSPVAVEDHIYQRVEFLRTSRGHERLPRNESLRAVARYHSEEMAREGYVGHEGPGGETLSDRLARFGVDCEASAETVGRARFGVPVEAERGGTVTYETAEEVAKVIVRRWMDEANPRSEILRLEWNRVAVGVEVVETTDGAVVYATQNFCEA